MLVGFKEALFCLCGANQDHLVVFTKGNCWVGINIQFIPGVNGDYAAARLSPDLTFNQRFAYKGCVQRRAGNIQPLFKHQNLIRFQEIDNGIGAHRSIGHHQVGSRLMQPGNISILNLIGNLPLFQCFCCCATDAAATQYQDRGIGGMINTINAEDLIIFLELFRGSS